MATGTKRQKIEDENPSTSTQTKSMKKSKNSGKNAHGAIDWDVDDYRTDYESEEQWELRRSFMVAHKDRFDEDRLVCLAQTFINIEFMGCKYSAEIMMLVAELSKDIVGEFRKSRAMRLKRTFVSASDAAEQRAKGRAAPTNTPQQMQECQSQTSRGSRDRLCFGGGEPIDLFEGLRFGNLVVYLAGGRSCLRNACNIAKIKYDERQSVEQTNEMPKAEVLVNDEVIASGMGENIKAAKLAAYKQAVPLLQMHCYSIKLNAKRETIKVEKGKEGLKINVTKESADNMVAGETKLGENNIGYRMMRLMGWTGGGLGRQKQGREEPVGYLLKNNRMGLGSNDLRGNLADYQKLIENYVNSDDMRDMQFEPTFSKEERAAFHQIAGKFGLRSNSYGTGESRRLLITKKISYNVILREVLSRRNQKFCERYFVQVPMHKAHLFPGHVAALDLECIME